MRQTTHRNSQRRGYAMLIVMILILTTTALAAVHQRDLSAALRLEQARVASEQRIAGPVAVMAVACQRLESGEPPAPVSYQYTHVIAGVATLYRIDYVVNGNRWTVTADPDPNAGGLTPLPDRF